MLRIARRIGKWLLYAIGAGAIVLATIVLLYAIQARVRFSGLRAWHRMTLEQEFRAGAAGAPGSFNGYRQLEERLFAELHRRLMKDPAAADTQLLGRFNPSSVPAHLALDTTYNRSYELTPSAPRGAVLLVHGLSDSPYSMRAMAETFFAQGFYVLVLRLPGHGTIPSALRDVRWQDWYEAVVLAAKHAAEQVGPGKPFLAGGHSTGAALVTLYSVRALEDPALPKPRRLYLVSPAIGITPFAVLTNVVAGLSFIPYFEKSEWMDVYPEYDPYKYNSFPVNAANQIHRLTRVVQRTIQSAGEAGRLGRMPRVVVFQSLVDSTVTAAEVVRGLLSLLPPGGHELVVFDVNHSEMLDGLLAPGPGEQLERLKSASDLPFRLTIIGNRPGGGVGIAEFVKESRAREAVQQDLPLEWPQGVFSLGHVALPIPPDDPVYGLAPPPGVARTYNLGGFSARGESGALVMPLGTFARLRYNPFFDVIRAKVIATATEGTDPSR